MFRRGIIYNYHVEYSVYAQNFGIHSSSENVIFGNFFLFKKSIWINNRKKSNAIGNITTTVTDTLLNWKEILSQKLKLVQGSYNT